MKAAPLRVGLIGGGNRAVSGFLPFLNVMPEFTLVAVADESPERLQLACRESRAKLSVFSDFRELLALEELDAVIIATPSLTHTEICAEALAAGKPVYCEKPLATTLADCDLIAAASERTGVPVMVGLQLRYAELYQRMKQVAESGVIGTLRMLWCKEFREPFRPGWQEWRLSAASSGGSLLEKNCHHFDLFSWFAESQPLRVAGFGGGDSVYAGRDIIDNAWIVAEYGNGVKASLGLCLFSPFGNDLEFGMVGDRGMVQSYFRRGELNLQYSDRDEQTTYRVSSELGHLGHGGAEAGALRAFAAMVDEGVLPVTDLRAGRESMIASLAAEQAIRERRVVEIDDLRETAA